MLELGFAAAQGTSDDLLFCGPPALGQRFPDILASYDRAQPAPCLDLHLAGSLDGGVRRLDVEARPLPELLAGLGDDDAADRLHSALGGPVTDALVAIREVLPILFERPAQANGPGAG